MMKYFWFPAVVLALLLGLSLWNGSRVGREVDGWCGIVEEARADARRGDLSAATERMAELNEDWRVQRTYYHSILEHGELDDVEELLTRAASALESGDADSFDAEAAALAGQLRILAEMQGLSMENIL